MLEERQMQTRVETNFHCLNVRVYFKIGLLKQWKCVSKSVLWCVSGSIQQADKLNQCKYLNRTGLTPDTSTTSFSTEGCQLEQREETCFPQHCKLDKPGRCALHCSLYNADPSEGHTLHFQGISWLKWSICNIDWNKRM